MNHHGDTEAQRRLRGDPDRMAGRDLPAILSGRFFGEVSESALVPWPRDRREEKHFCNVFTKWDVAAVTERTLLRASWNCARLPTSVAPGPPLYSALSYESWAD